MTTGIGRVTLIVLVELPTIIDTLSNEERVPGSPDYNYTAKFLLEGLENRLRVLLPSQQRLTAIEPNDADASGLG